MLFQEKTFVLGVGSQKTGTTWLHKYLSSRGDIYMPARKELHYFDAKYRPDMCGAARRERLAEWSVSGHACGTGDVHEDEAYREFFRRRVPDEIHLFGEITPTYALIGEAGYRKIRDLFRNVRVIFMMRDPVERFCSQTRMFRNKKIAKSKPRLQIDKLASHKRFLELSRYERTIRALEAVFEGRELAYLFYESLFREETIRRLCAFLCIDYRPAEFDSLVNFGGERDAIPPLIEDKLLRKFEPTYQFCREKFGVCVPREWRDARTL